MKLRKKRKAAALIVSMIFMLIFSALAVSLATISDTNTQIADNLRKANGARACAESGLEIIRCWFDQVTIPGETPESERFDLIASSFQSAVTGISNITTSRDTSTTVTVPTVALLSENAQSFSAQIIKVDDGTLQVSVTGTNGSVTKTITVNYEFATRAHTVFDFGVATKGPLSLAGNIQLEGVNISVESDVYIESENSNLALSITGNSQIAGNVNVVNPVASVLLQGGQAGIGGETGQDAIDNHVSFGVPPTEFPAPNPDHFEQYANNVVDSSTDTSTDTTFENIKIVAGTNPTFSGNVTLKGVVFIEVPNVVTFAGNAAITGIVVGNGAIEDDSGTSQINFLGTVDSCPISELPDEPQFEEIRDETGTFALAPGFSMSFGGNFSTLSGAMAANGIEFFGNAGGTINGSILNYSDEAMILSGNSDLYFNRSGTTQVPAGFVPEIVLQYNPSSYSENLF